MTWLEAQQSCERSRFANRPAAVRPRGERNHSCSDCSRRSAAASSWCFVQIPGIARDSPSSRRCLPVKAEFRDVGLPYGDCASRSQSGNVYGIGCLGRRIEQENAALSRRKSDAVFDILDPKRHAGKRANVFSPGNLRIDFRCSFVGAVAIEHHECVQSFVLGVDHRECVVHGLHGGEFSALHLSRGVYNCLHHRGPQSKWP